MHVGRILCFGSEDFFAQVRIGLTDAGHQFDRANSPEDLFEALQSRQYSLALIEHNYADLDAAAAVAFSRGLPLDVMTIFVASAHTRVSEAAQLIKAGAYGFLDAGVGPDRIAEVAESALEEAHQRTAAAGQDGVAWQNLLIGESPCMQDLARIIRLVARRRSTVLITGETGTGKEMAARAIHSASDRSHLPMVAVNCSAIPENLLESELFGHTKGAFTGAVTARAGRFEQANESTLFLDEIGDMPVDLQAKLLRALQEREIQRLGSSETIRLNVRVIAASNVNLMDRVKQGRFREDLYYRLNVVPIAMPRLRDRAGDIPLLTRHFIKKVCELERIPPKQVYQDTLRRLMVHSWPGNVRQLENVVEKAVVMSGDREVLLAEDFALPSDTAEPPANISAVFRFTVPDHGMDFEQAVTSFEKGILREALKKTNGNRTMAAELLGLKRTTLVSKLRVLESL